VKNCYTAAVKLDKLDCKIHCSKKICQHL